MNVLVLGCGEMAQQAIEDLVVYGGFDKVIIGTRRPEKAEILTNKLKGRRTKLSACRLDVTDQRSLVDAMKEVDVVVNSAGPFYKCALPVAKTALQAKVDLVDMCDDYEVTPRLLELDSEAKNAGITMIVGLGASPGINNVLARLGGNLLDEVEEIHTAWVMSGADPGGLALSYHLLYSLSDKALTYQDGKYVEVRSFVDGEEVLEFPEPVGKQEVFHIGHPEPVTLPRYFPGVKYVDDKATFNPPLVNSLIVQMRRLGLCSEEPIFVGNTSIRPMDFAAAFLNKTCKAMKDVPKDGALRVEVKGTWHGRKTSLRYSASGRIAAGTGIAASVGAQFLAERMIEEKGVFAPEGCLDPGEFMREILNREIGQLKTERIEE